jgi:hypothetical protein
MSISRRERRLLDRAGTALGSSDPHLAAMRPLRRSRPTRLPHESTATDSRARRTAGHELLHVPGRDRRAWRLGGPPPQG